MVNVLLPEGTRDSDWLLFNGRAEFVQQSVLLFPYEQSFVSLKMNKQDVHVALDIKSKLPFTFIKRGSKYVSRNLIGPPPDASSVGRDRASTDCPHNSACIGNVEWCCETGEEKGECYGIWDDCA
jgi:hypothetical protein